MSAGDLSPRIREEDIQARPLARRAFLGRFTAAGVAGLVGLTAACEPTDTCDGDQGGDSIQSDDDGTDDATFDQDIGDPCDSDGVSF